ncbi:MAG: hypothetical protein LT105_16010 [Lentimicrobium sp.]|nr:hypothetical protein [Lentimicrobium sp.]
MQQSYPGINPSINEWKGQEIVDFQEELLIKVNAHISEKWFYSHFKSDNANLPRIDILNILSRYAGYANWDDFRFKNSSPETVLDKVRGANRYFFYVPAATFLILGVLFILFRFLSSREYRFSFYDADTAEPITNFAIKVDVLSDNESPVSYLCEADGSFTLKTSRAAIRFVVESPYYHTDTIVRTLNKFNTNEKVKLRPDYYALMIKYFSGSRVEDWQKRRDQLNHIISDSALIYQVHNNSEPLGVELYNKWEFIDILSLPSSGLKAIEIFDTRYDDDKICLIRFRQKEAGK